jgi:hypothetical protein
VVVGQAEFADVIVLNGPNPIVAAALRRLSPRARINVGADRVEDTLDNQFPNARRGRRDDPHGPLLVGQPPLDSTGSVRLVESMLDGHFTRSVCTRAWTCCWRASFEPAAGCG